MKRLSGIALQVVLLLVVSSAPTQGYGQTPAPTTQPAPAVVDPVVQLLRAFSDKSIDRGTLLTRAQALAPALKPDQKTALSSSLAERLVEGRQVADLTLEELSLYAAVQASLGVP